MARLEMLLGSESARWTPWRQGFPQRPEVTAGALSQWYSRNQVQNERRVLAGPAKLLVPFLQAAGVWSGGS